MHSEVKTAKKSLKHSAALAMDEKNSYNKATYTDRERRTS